MWLHPLFQVRPPPLSLQSACCVRVLNEKLHYEWKKVNNSKNSKGDKLSLDLLLTPNVVLELGVDDNNIQKKDNFAKLSFVFPSREGPAASTDFIADEAFPGGDMSSQLLSKVKRSNKITLESEGVGVTISRLD